MLSSLAVNENAAYAYMGHIYPFYKKYKLSIYHIETNYT